MKRGCALVVLSVAATLHAFAQAEQVCDTRLGPLSSPLSRFEVHPDGTVTDKESRLMWMRCSAGQTASGPTCSGAAVSVDLASARSLAAAVNQGGQFFYSDWRVPQLKELATIAERQCENPRVNLTVFPNTPAGRYWTASSRSPAESRSHAFALGFDAEGVVYRAVGEAMHVRLVRDDGARR
jgi:Protein of unknown function (DUF1566)